MISGYPYRSIIDALQDCGFRWELLENDYYTLQVKVVNCVSIVTLLFTPWSGQCPVQVYTWFTPPLPHSSTNLVLFVCLHTCPVFFLVLWTSLVFIVLFSAAASCSERAVFYFLFAIVQCCMEYDVLEVGHSSGQASGSFLCEPFKC